MRKPTIYKRLIFVLFIFLLSDYIEAQIVIGTPNLGFSQACASDSFNTYNTSFVFSPESGINASNQFIIELSDSVGDFSDPTVVFTSDPGSVTVSPATLSFSIPTTTAGEGYRIRIKSTAPAATSSRSAAFAAYFRLQNTPFSINNLVSTGAYCSGGGYLLTIDNPGTGLNISPLNFPSLTFNWFRETGPTTSVFVSTGPTLLVDQEGTYFVETNYGSCTSDSFSNRVTISEATSGGADATIISSLGNPYCSVQGLTTLTTIGGNSYQWFIDGVAIPDATNQTYQTDQPGVYSVQVDLGNCETAGSIDLETGNFTSSINVSDVNDIEEGESLLVTVTTTATDPEFEWYLNDSLIPGETEDTFEATEFGNYRVVITQTSGCVVSNEILFVINESLDPFPDVDSIPNLVSPNGDGINDTWVIPTQYVSGTNTEVLIMTNKGEITFQTNDYLNNWPDNQLELNSVNQVYYYIIRTLDEEVKKGSITIIK